MSKKNFSGPIVKLVKIEQEDYISLNQIVQSGNFSEPSERIKRWLRSNATIKYLAEWEYLHNQDFNSVGFNRIKNDLFEDSFTVTPTRWVELTNAKGIIPGKRGRYSKGAFAHIDIALHFAGFLSPAFQLYMLKEFRRLKQEEQIRLGDPFNIKRFLTAGSYSLLVHSLLSKIDERLLTHPQPYKNRLPFAAEADMINQIVFGQSAKQWRFNNPKTPTDRNQRDFASVLELVVLNCMEVIGAMLIQWDVVELKEREKILQETYDFITPILKRSKTIQDLQNLADKANQ